MSEDAKAADKPAPPPAARPAGKLKTWERWVAGGVGLAGAGAGGAGVFLSDNQAGTTAILLLGAVFVLLAVQGTTILKASKEGIEVSAREAEQQVVDGANNILETQGKDEAAAFIEGATTRDPELADTPGVRQLNAQLYELQVLEALRRVADKHFGRSLVVSTGDRINNLAFDYVIRGMASEPSDPGVLIEALFTPGTRLSTSRLQRTISRFTHAGLPGLIVSNQPPTTVAMDTFFRAQEAAGLNLVVWRGKYDDDALGMAVQKAIDFLNDRRVNVKIDK